MLTREVTHMMREVNTIERSMATSPQEKFDAAVKVIRGLPKDGSFQPSNELMLKFYAYYKQATEGPCTAPKPGIWNMVNRKKWEAWAELSQMQKETAMLRYVEELKHIVETMPQTDQVADFVNTLGSFYEVIEEEGRVSPSKNAKQSNGIVQLNGEGLATNGHSNSTDDNNISDEDNKMDEEKEDVDFGSLQLESGSDGEEFCDTSDHVEQVPESDVVGVTGQRSDNKVRFAPIVSVADESVTSTSNLSDSDLSTILRDVSAINSQMESERLSLWATSEFAFLPENAGSPPHRLTDSLCVNSSFSSLVSLADSESVTGRDREFTEDSTLEAEDMTCVDQCQVVTCRGGGDEKEAGSQTPRSSIRGARGSASQGSRDGAHQRTGGSSSSSSSHRNLFPSGPGGGDRGRGGQGRPMSSVDEQILLTLLHMQQDLVGIANRLAALELSVKLQREEQGKKDQESKRWPFQGLSKKWAILLVVWPFLMPLVINLLFRRRRSSPS